MPNLTVQYFALLREETKKDREEISSAAATAAELYEELRRRYALSLPPEAIRVAINGEFRRMDTLLQAHDNLVFVPPVAGG